MKKIVVVALFIALLGLASCKKQEQVNKIVDDMTVQEHSETDTMDKMDKEDWEWTEEEMAEMKWEDEMMNEDEKMDDMMDKEEWEWTEGEVNEMEEKDMMMEDDDKIMDTKVEVKSKWVYADYLPSLLASADWDIVLFFAASWCPSCRSADEALKSADIPDWLTVLKVDYDNSAELKKQYGITSQHSFVQVDNKLNMITKWSGAKNVDDIVAKLK